MDRIVAVLVNLSLPDSQGIETFDRIFHAVPQIPILVLSAAEDEDTAKLAVERGAQDYLLRRHVDSYLLPKALRSMVKRAANAEALFVEKERAQVTLNSIGDAVICTDVGGHVTYLNAVAEGLTGWMLVEAAGRPLEQVVRIVNSNTREPVPNPMTLANRDSHPVGLTSNCILIRRDGVEAAIEDSVAPIHDRQGQVTGAVMVFRDVTTARTLSLSMSFLAQHDSLTKLPNRALFSDRLSQAMVLAQRQQQMLAVLFLDVDRFKHINDSLGHAIGDRLLHAVAQRLLGCVRSSDTVGRQGGDEFVILLAPVAHAENAAVIAGNLLRNLSEPFRIDHHDLHITVSIGVATYPGDGTEAEELLKHADFAMYYAKENERNNYQFYQVETSVRSVTSVPGIRP
jgi:diguanylate cyclase (GGDEF)-like protein/PAS domain S-box-containing protein